MITQWRVSNFKSVGIDTALTFAPLTVFAGANSSGKSTILQSILMAAQTTASKIPTRSVVLNGHMVKLGQLNDLKNHFGKGEEIKVGWTCDFRQDSGFPRRAPTTSNFFPQTFRESADQIQAVSVDISFGAVGQPGSSLEQLQPTLTLVQITGHLGASDGASYPVSMEITLERSLKDKLKSIGIEIPDSLEKPGREALYKALLYTPRFNEEATRRFELSDTEDNVEGCILNHFLPSGVIVTYDEPKAFAESIIRALRTARVSPEFRARTVPNSVMQLIEDRLPTDLIQVIHGAPVHSILPDGITVTLGELTDRLRRFTGASKRNELRQHIQAIELDILSLVSGVGHAKDVKRAFRPVSLPAPLDTCVEHIERWFNQRIRYLGPLRDEPKPLYPLMATADPADVGLRGEHTAAVLHIHRDRQVRYYPAEEFATFGIAAKPKHVTLTAAVRDWLRYMGVATDFETEDEGKFGHALRIRLFEGDQLHDLTHVGVGASQVLPIVVICLLAQIDTCMIFEQPELHLHPKVQTRLADFFLSMAMLRKQCVLETHSEYLINRLRFRAASAPGTEVSALLKLYFAEKVEGISDFREVEVNQYGAVLDWPEGFFDQSQEEAESILRAASSKRRRDAVTPRRDA